MKLLVLRGLPGCGKSTWVRTNHPGATPAVLAPKGWSPVVVSADHFFTDFSTGEYRMDLSKLGQAHSAAHVRVIKAMVGKSALVIVDNTHVRRWEWSVDAAAAVAFGYELEIVDLFDGGSTNADLAIRNVHGVPEHVIARMRTEWER